jgi:hypothetical protein
MIAVSIVGWQQQRSFYEPIFLSVCHRVYMLQPTSIQMPASVKLIGIFTIAADQHTQCLLRQ